MLDSLMFSSYLLQLSDNMSSYLDKLLNSSTGNFWASGLVFVMVRHQIAFMHNGKPECLVSAVLFKFYYTYFTSEFCYSHHSFISLQVNLCWTDHLQTVLIITARFYV